MKTSKPAQADRDKGRHHSNVDSGAAKGGMSKSDIMTSKTTHGAGAAAGNQEHA